MSSPSPVGYISMNVSAVPRGAEAVRAEVRVVAPLAAAQVFLLAHRSADGTGFEQIGDNVAGISPPALGFFLLFANPGQFFITQHVRLRTSHCNPVQSECQPNRPLALVSFEA